MQSGKIQVLDEKYMARALELARQAWALDEVPVGAVIVKEGEIIAEAFNHKEGPKDPTGHAELRVIQKASENLGAWRLNDCQLYVTLEPCLMCAGAILQARIGSLIFGTRDPKGGAVRSLFQTLNDSRLNHQVEVREGVLQVECSQILTDFFKARRQHSLPSSEVFTSPDKI